MRRLAYFVAATQQHGGFAAAAAELHITQSTLSAALKTLAEEVGAPLFEHVQRRLHPSRAGLWLFRSALPILHAEEFARRPETGVEPTHLIVDVKLSFALGRVSKAVGRAVQRFGEAKPHVFVEPRFVDMADDDESIAAVPPIGARGASTLVVDAVSLDHRHDEPGIEQIELKRDPWVIVRNMLCTQDDSGEVPFIVPALGEPLLRQLSGIVGARGCRRVHLADEPAGALPRMLHEQPTATFLMPRSMAADRLGLQNIIIRPFVPAVESAVVARFRKGDEDARQMAQLIREALDAAEQNLIFRPVISLRQLRYHRALYDAGSVTAAARTLFVAQPALTDQLRKLEQVLGRDLFSRSRRGLQPTAAAARLRQTSLFVQDRVRRIGVENARFLGGETATLRIGVIPSAGPGSLLLHGLARTIERWGSANPTMRLQVLEAQTDPLQTMVKAGTVSFAIVERSIPDVARMRLTGSEPLALVFDPLCCSLPPDELGFRDLEGLPLVLPTAQSGLRQIIDEAAMKVGIRLLPRYEVNSMPLLIQLLRGRTLYSVLPAGAATRDLSTGVLASRSLASEVQGRQFYAIHSAERNLTDSERGFIHILQKELRREKPRSEAGGRTIAVGTQLRTS